jgi:four helix bundle protein
MRNFENLRIWQESRLLGTEIYNLFIHSKDFGFKDQIQRAAISISNNIAEGCESGSDKIFARYLQIAKGSCAEVKSMLYLSEDIGICEKSKADELRNQLNLIIFGIQKMLLYLNSKNK